jgi:hypothetical protein
MFLASLGPVLMTPTLLYFAGVPGALKPWSCSNLTSTFLPSGRACRRRERGDGERDRRDDQTELASR